MPPLKSFPTSPQTPTALRMLPLLERGRETWIAFVLRLPPVMQPIGGATMDIVLHADFVANVELCLRFTREMRRTLYILDQANDLSTLVAPFTWR